MQTQISGYITQETKATFEAFAKKSGQKKGFILEQALLHYINAREELPEDIVIPPTLSVDQQTYDDLINNEKAPSDALKKLMHED